VAVFRAALDAVDPSQLVAAHLGVDGAEVLVDTLARWPRPTLVVGAGKAAARMAAGCEAVLGPEHVHGEVIVADGCGVALRSIAVSEAGHPLPDLRGAHATLRLLERVERTTAGGILCLISGGASSLLVCPRPPLTLPEKIATTQLLLDCGAEIHELNTVRKHLSDVKGGGLLRRARRRVATLMISDVVGNDCTIIGSGPTTPDPTTFADASAILERYGLADRVPPAAATLLRDGIAGRVAETLKPDDPAAAHGASLVVGSNRRALDGAAARARAHGWTVQVRDEPLTGDTRAAAEAFGAQIRVLAGTRARSAPVCLLAGGETTVRVMGKGRGGRNQEFALMLVEQLAGEDVVVLSAGSDGIDGPTDAAGAFIDGTTLQRARERGLDPRAALADNDSYGFFAALGDLYRCGPTGTNVSDLKIALIAARRTGVTVLPEIH
jgi:glycerate 2-kinase